MKLHSVLHRQPLLLNGILAQWGISIIDPATFSSSFLINNQPTTERVLSFLHAVIDLSCNITSTSNESTSNTHFLVLFNRLRVASLQTTIGCVLHNFMVSGSMCVTTSSGTAGFIYVTIYTETDCVLPNIKCGLCAATLIF